MFSICYPVFVFLFAAVGWKPLAWPALLAIAFRFYFPSNGLVLSLPFIFEFFLSGGLPWPKNEEPSFCCELRVEAIKFARGMSVVPMPRVAAFKYMGRLELFARLPSWFGSVGRFESASLFSPMAKDY